MVNINRKIAIFILFGYNCLKGALSMSMAKKIKTIILERDMTIKDLSEKLGYNSTYLYNKLNRDKLTEDECRKIADALNCDYDGIFTFRDTGKQV